MALKRLGWAHIRSFNLSGWQTLQSKVWISNSKKAPEIRLQATKQDIFFPRHLSAPPMPNTTSQCKISKAHPGETNFAICLCCSNRTAQTCKLTVRPVARAALQRLSIPSDPNWFSPRLLAMAEGREAAAPQTTLLWLWRVAFEGSVQDVTCRFRSETAYGLPFEALSHFEALSYCMPKASSRCAENGGGDRRGCSPCELIIETFYVSIGEGSHCLLEQNNQIRSSAWY